jgi:hypothetical protein
VVIVLGGSGRGDGDAAAIITMIMQLFLLAQKLYVLQGLNAQC